MKILGIDPAKEIALKAKSNGVDTIAKFFSTKLAEEIKIDYGVAKVITANNVFAHADDLVDIVAGCKILLEDNGIFVFEVQYLSDLYLNGLFDMIYHEHLSYHSVGPLNSFFMSNGMKMIDVSRVSTHGCSIRCVVQKNNGAHNATITITGSQPTDLSLSQVGNTTQSYTLSQNCITSGGCSVTVTQGN